jgi:hypothetical protein
MAEQVYLSLWLRDFSEQNMLGYWAAALELFPHSTLAPGLQALAVFPLTWSEAPVLQHSFGDSMGAAEALQLAAEFLHDDYAYEAELNWDVWVTEVAGRMDQWKREPQSVAVACMGPGFEGGIDAEQQGHLQLKLGLDSIFLPPGELAEEAKEGVAATCYKDNIGQLLQYLHRLEQKLPLVRRRLWSSSGENLADQIRAAWRL